jgi:hypothetical protein
MTKLLSAACRELSADAPYDGELRRKAPQIRAFRREELPKPAFTEEEKNTPSKAYLNT